MGKWEPGKPTSFSKVIPLISSTILDPYFPAMNFIFGALTTYSLPLRTGCYKHQNHVTWNPDVPELLSLFRCMASNLNSVPLLNSVSNGKSNSSLVSLECDRADQQNYNTVYSQRSAQMLTAPQTFRLAKPCTLPSTRARRTEVRTNSGMANH